jgi:hypothetical protein
MGLAWLTVFPAKATRLVSLSGRSSSAGFATYQDYGPFFWDRFYHVILPSDTHLINFLKDIGLGDQIRWSRTLTGFYVDERFYSVSNSLEFLRFPLVSLWGKFRLVMTLLYCSRIRDWQRLEKITVEDWLIKTCGRTTYEKMWKPLLLAKLGESYRRVSAVLFGPTSSGSFPRAILPSTPKSVWLCSGGYKTVWSRLEELIHAGEEILTTASPCSESSLVPREACGLKSIKIDSPSTKLSLPDPRISCRGLPRGSFWTSRTAAPP